MRDTTPITTEITRLIGTGTITQQELIALVAHLADQFPDMTSAELSQALQDATAPAEKKAAQGGTDVRQGSHPADAAIRSVGRLSAWVRPDPDQVRRRVAVAGGKDCLRSTAPLVGQPQQAPTANSEALTSPPVVEPPVSVWSLHHVTLGRTAWRGRPRALPIDIAAVREAPDAMIVAI
jgi:hypothetical protein